MKEKFSSKSGKAHPEGTIPNYSVIVKGQIDETYSHKKEDKALACNAKFQKRKLHLRFHEKNTYLQATIMLSHYAEESSTAAAGLCRLRDFETSV